MFLCSMLKQDIRKTELWHYTASTQMVYNLQMASISEFSIKEQPSGMMDVITDPDISFRMQVSGNKVNLFYSLDSYLQCDTV